MSYSGTCTGNGFKCVIVIRNEWVVEVRIREIPTVVLAPQGDPLLETSAEAAATENM